MAPDRQPLAVLHVFVCSYHVFPARAAKTVQDELMAPVPDVFFLILSSLLGNMLSQGVTTFAQLQKQLRRCVCQPWLKTRLQEEHVAEDKSMCCHIDAVMAPDRHPP